MGKPAQTQLSPSDCTQYREQRRLLRLREVELFQKRQRLIHSALQSEQSTQLKDPYQNLRHQEQEVRLELMKLDLLLHPEPHHLTRTKHHRTTAPPVSQKRWLIMLMLIILVLVVVMQLLRGLSVLPSD